MANKPDKGLKNGSCNRTACQQPGANYFNKSTKAYYCEPCAKSINWEGGRADCMKLYGVPLLCEFEEYEMTEEQLHSQFDEFMDEFKDQIKASTHLMLLTQTVISSRVGFSVDMVNSRILKKDIADEYIPYIGNKLCKLSLIGSAFPMESSWRIEDNGGKTIFTAEGFSGELKSFTFDYFDGKATLVLIDSDKLLHEDMYYYLNIGYTKESAEAMELHIPPDLSKLS